MTEDEALVQEYFFSKRISRLWGGAPYSLYPCTVATDFRSGKRASQQAGTQVLEACLSLMDSETPGILALVGEDAGPGLAYVAHVLPETRVVGIMTNRHLADEARHWLREQDLSLRAPVFAGPLDRPDSWRVMGTVPVVLSPFGLGRDPGLGTILDILWQRLLPRGALILGFFHRTGAGGLGEVPGARSLETWLWPHGVSSPQDQEELLTRHGFVVDNRNTDLVRCPPWTPASLMASLVPDGGLNKDRRKEVGLMLACLRSALKAGTVAFTVVRALRQDR